ncbi:hypothetical protein GIB67_029925 [Kingdonia uniflora]|uniref:Uncharacterized protein n=1 Tax=Kingdonia uniflora TaxID=39325 RepID=A0A7J7MXV0_9MAGN|nr:hypothetical protein GIB67_029925 [Kingdonia uniflora]
MDLCYLHVNSSKQCSLSYPFLQRSSSSNPSWTNVLKMGSLTQFEDLGLKSRGSLVVLNARGKKNSSSSGGSDQSVPEGDGSDRSNPAHDSNKFDDKTNKSHNVIHDWRTVRANLVAREQVLLEDTEVPFQDGMSTGSSKALGSRWAHPISTPEAGCILVATEKLDGVRTFERSVVLLLRSGNKDPLEGPFGVVINRPLHKKIKDVKKPSNTDLATTFSECSVQFGGPLEASMFLLKTKEKLQLSEFEQVIPGLCFGARNRLEEAAALVRKGVLRPQDFRFFLGYAGWQMDQLIDEINSDYWHVAACSTNLILGSSTDSSSGNLWEEVLQLMGGEYSELSRKPKQDS